MSAPREGKDVRAKMTTRRDGHCCGALVIGPRLVRTLIAGDAYVLQCMDKSTGHRTVIAVGIAKPSVGAERDLFRIADERLEALEPFDDSEDFRIHE